MQQLQQESSGVGVILDLFTAPCWDTLLFVIVNFPSVSSTFLYLNGLLFINEAIILFSVHQPNEVISASTQEGRIHLWSWFPGRMRMTESGRAGRPVWKLCWITTSTTDAVTPDEGNDWSGSSFYFTCEFCKIESETSVFIYTPSDQSQPATKKPH